jgi:hypothetical protein
LINSVLENIDVIWLCENVGMSDMILNRILRYPEKSTIISNWAHQHYKQDNYRIRRAELAGWILDETPNFEIDKQTLIDDFEYFNIIDINAIQEYENELAATKIIERDLKGILTIQASAPTLNLTKRPYIPTPDFSKDYNAYVPDFKKMRAEFYPNIDLSFNLTMLWAIAYSRLDNTVKSELLKKYYCPEIYWSFFKICNKLRLSELLRWLMDKQK